MVQKELYLLEPIHFLRSATVKSNFLAYMSRNNDVTEAYQERLPENLLPYYRHMTGEYILPYDYTNINGQLVPNYLIYTKFDEMIQVQSWDSNETIDFTRENLKFHPKTAEWYRIPNTLFFKLCEKYPTQVDLIKNIIYPIDSIDDAVNAPCFALLQYDKDLLEPNELVTIISAINNFLNYASTRWAVKEFCFEHMYPVVMQDIIWKQLYNCIMAQRVLNIRTDHVHSYHVWEYLKSKGLKDYRDILSTKKALFLYRNMEYILRNQGTRRTFSILLGSLLSDLNVKIQQKAIVQTIEGSDVNSIIDPGVFRTNAGLSNTSSIQTQCKPAVKILSFDAGDPTIVKQAQMFTAGNTELAGDIGGNFTEHVLGMSNDIAKDTHISIVHNGTIETTSNLYKKEQDTGLEYTNELLFKDSTEKQDKLFPLSPNTILKTKVHEISEKVSSDLLNDLYVGYITNAILYRAHLNHLEFAVHVSNGDDIDLWLINGKEAVALMMYAAMKSVGKELSVPAKTAWLTHAYLTEFPAIPETFHYNNREYKTSQYLTDHGFSDMVAHPLPFFNREDMEYTINQEAKNYLNNYFQLHFHPTGKGTEIFAKVFASRMTYGWYDLDLFDGQETYKAYFDSHAEIKSVIDKYNETADAQTAYEELFILLMTSMFENLDNNFGVGIVSRATMYKLKQLFISLCSYNISFVDSTTGLDAITTTLGRFSNELEFTNHTSPHVDARYIPKVSCLTRFKDMYHADVPELKSLGFRQNVASNISAINIGITDDPVKRCTTQMVGLTTVRDFKLSYYVENYGLVDVQVLLQMLYSLINYPEGFNYTRQNNEYRFLRGNNVLIEEHNDKDQVIHIKLNPDKESFVLSCIDWFTESLIKAKEDLTPKDRVYAGSYEHNRKFLSIDENGIVSEYPEYYFEDVIIENKLLPLKGFDGQLIPRTDTESIVRVLCHTGDITNTVAKDKLEAFSFTERVVTGTNDDGTINTQIRFYPYEQHEHHPDVKLTANYVENGNDELDITTSRIVYLVNDTEVTPVLKGFVENLSDAEVGENNMVYVKNYFTDSEGNKCYIGHDTYVYFNGQWTEPTSVVGKGETIQII